MAGLEPQLAPRQRRRAAYQLAEIIVEHARVAAVGHHALQPVLDCGRQCRIVFFDEEVERARIVQGQASAMRSSRTA